MQRFADWLARRPLLAVALVLLLSAGALVTLVDPFTRALRLDIDASIDKLLPASSDDRAVDNRVREMFGDSEAILVAVTLRPVFSADNLKRVTAITERFRELSGVRSSIDFSTDGSCEFLYLAEAVVISHKPRCKSILLTIERLGS